MPKKVKKNTMETVQESAIIKSDNNKMIIAERELESGMVIIARDEIYKIVGFETYNDYKRIEMEDVYGNKRTIGESDFKNYYHVAEGVDFDDVDQISDQLIKGEIPISFLKTEEKQENALMVVNTDLYLKRRDELMLKAAKVEAIQKMVRHKTEVMRNKIGGIITQYNKVISKLNKIIFTLELYAGIEENIKQIQSGEAADEKEPIHLMQIMKFMDEEVGDPSNGGISFDSIEKFDNWLLSFNKFLGYHNYELLIPFKKGVRIMRVRRNVSEKYSVDSFNNRWEIQQEMKTYVIIRNGENFYTISSKMHFCEKLFPDVKELTEFVESGGDFDDHPKMEGYKHGMILMQGLVDRTDVFGSVAGKISFLKPDSVEKGDVVFNYENEDMLITDGSISSLDFLNTSTIEAGDRVLVYNPELGYQARRIYKQFFRNEFCYPPAPQTGIYKLEYDSEYKCLYFRYNPKDTVWNLNEGSHERKRGFSYKINPSDTFVVNIDIVSHRNIEWIEKMMYDRRDRRHYLRAAGLLNAVKRYKRAELKEEEPFKNLVISVCKCSEEDALDAIHWWKTKNKHKRSLSVDDVKALRMISKKLKN